MFYIVHDSWPVLFGKFSAAGCPRRNSAVCWNCAPCGWSLVMAAELKSTGDQKWPRMAMKHGGKCWGNIWTNEKKDKKRLAASARVFFGEPFGKMLRFRPQVFTWWPRQMPRWNTWAFGFTIPRRWVGGMVASSLKYGRFRWNIYDISMIYVWYIYICMYMYDVCIIL